MDNSNNNYIYFSNKYYQIFYNSTSSILQTIESSILKSTNSLEMTKVGSMAQNNDFIIYGYYNNCLFFSSKSHDYIFSKKLENNLDGNLSCKFIEGENFICAMILNSSLTMLCLNYHINVSGSSYFDSYENVYSKYYNNILGVCLYDTEMNNIKLLCTKFKGFIQCRFIEIKFENSQSNFKFFGSNSLYFYTSINFSEKVFSLSLFNSEYLLCCAMTDFIKCYRINSSTYELIKGFQISKSGLNSCLTIKTNIINNDIYATFFFMNKKNNQNSIYEYYIYLPSCQNMNYSILNSLNENKSEDDFEKLVNLFQVKSNKCYFELKNPPEEFGYFTLNKEKIKNKTLISNNDYILDFIVTNKEIASNTTIIVYYIVSVEDDEAYSKECQIQLNFPKFIENENEFTKTNIRDK